MVAPAKSATAKALDLPPRPPTADTLPRAPLALVDKSEYERAPTKAKEAASTKPAPAPPAPPGPIQTSGAMKGMWAQSFCNTLKNLRWDFIHELWHDEDDYNTISADVTANGKNSGWFSEWTDFMVPNGAKPLAVPDPTNPNQTVVVQEGGTLSGLAFTSHHHGMMLAGQDLATQGGIGAAFTQNLAAWLPNADEAPAAFAARIKAIILQNIPAGASSDGIDSVVTQLTTLADDSQLRAFASGDALGIFIQTGYHNMVHNLLSNSKSPGDMGDPSKNIYNPLFYAHHGLIDYFVNRYYTLKRQGGTPAPDDTQFTQLATAAEQAMEIVPSTNATAAERQAMSGCTAHYAAAAHPKAKALGIDFWRLLAKTKKVSP